MLRWNLRVPTALAAVFPNRAGSRYFALLTSMAAFSSSTIAGSFSISLLATSFNPPRVAGGSTVSSGLANWVRGVFRASRLRIATLVDDAIPHTSRQLFRPLGGWKKPRFFCTAAAS